MHDGMYGRSHLYTYVKSSNGSWWKILDHDVTQVCLFISNLFHLVYSYLGGQVTEEAVLTDKTGLYMNAGPYLLFYTRSDESSMVDDSPVPPITEEAPWDEGVAVRLFSLLC